MSEVVDLGGLWIKNMDRMSWIKSAAAIPVISAGEY